MKRNRLLAVLISIICLLVCIVVSFILLLVTRVKKEVYAEAGQSIEADAFRRYSWDHGRFVWLEEPDMSLPGKAQGKVLVYPVTYPVTVQVTRPAVSDETPPEVVAQEVTVYAEETGQLSAEQFILEIQDDSECTVSFFKEPEVTVYGKQPVQILVKDAVGNSTVVDTSLTIINLKETLVWELGTSHPSPEEFLYAAGSDVSFVTDITHFNLTEENNYEVILSVDGTEANSLLQIKDSFAPYLVLKEAVTWLNKPLEPTLFIDFEQTFDNSDAIEAVFTEEPDWSVLGTQTVSVAARDNAGNTSIGTTTVTVQKDEKPPVVTVTDIDVKVGGTVSYKKAVNYYDDIDSKEEMKLTIERSGVNLKETGTYEVVYTVTDCSGNSTSVTGKINVVSESPKWEDEEAIHKKANEILDEIIKDGMTEREKAKAIYTWVKKNVGYISHSEKGNYVRGAYEGLFKEEGDCFVYASTSKELLTQAGIPNIDIVKSTKNPSHYWNLVYMEDGWYHFDTTPRKDKSDFFLLTDAELDAYSKTHNNTHIFDRSLYPEIQ